MLSLIPRAPRQFFSDVPLHPPVVFFSSSLPSLVWLFLGNPPPIQSFAVPPNRTCVFLDPPSSGLAFSVSPPHDPVCFFTTSSVLWDEHFLFFHTGHIIFRVRGQFRCRFFPLALFGFVSVFPQSDTRPVLTPENQQIPALFTNSPPYLTDLVPIAIIGFPPLVNFGGGPSPLPSFGRFSYTPPREVFIQCFDTYYLTPLL